MQHSELLVFSIALKWKQLKALGTLIAWWQERTTTQHHCLGGICMNQEAQHSKCQKDVFKMNKAPNFTGSCWGCHPNASYTSWKWMSPEGCFRLLESSTGGVIRARALCTKGPRFKPWCLRQGRESSCLKSKLWLSRTVQIPRETLATAVLLPWVFCCCAELLGCTSPNLINTLSQTSA